MTFLTTLPGTVPVYSVRTSLLSVPPRTLSPFSSVGRGRQQRGEARVGAHQLGRVGRAVLGRVDVLPAGVSGSWA